MQTKREKKLSKLDATCSQLRDMAYQLGPGEKMPTVSQLRGTLGVSLTTLSSALDELEARDVLHRKHGVGIYVSSALQKTIALVCDPSYFGTAGQSPFWDLLVQNVRQRAGERPEAFEFHFAQPRGVGLNQGLQNEILNERIHGVLAVGLDRTVTEWIEEQDVPTVVYAGYGRCFVANNSEHGIQLGTRKLASRGCQRIEMWEDTPRKPSQQTSAVARVFLQTLKRLKLENQSSQVRQCGIDWSLSTPQEQGYHLAQQVFSQPREMWPHGIVIGNDMMTVGVLRSLQNARVEPGTDVQIATHANAGSPALVGYENKLLLMEFDPGELTEAMFHILDDLMAGRKPAHNQISLKARLRDHQSTLARDIQSTLA
jgi:DNA-binding LacI/PurR family transcriptional regulator